MNLLYAYYPTSFGIWKIGYIEQLVYEVKVEQNYSLKENYRNNFTDRVMEEIVKYLEGKIKKLDIGYKLEGSEFQLRVWQATLKIEYGAISTYKELGEKLKTSPRAVGNALKKNPLLLLIPCHRVIGVKGNLTGYAGGLALKAYLLKLEKYGAKLS